MREAVVLSVFQIVPAQEAPFLHRPENLIDARDPLGVVVLAIKTQIFTVIAVEIPQQYVFTAGRQSLQAPFQSLRVTNPLALGPGFGAPVVDEKSQGRIGGEHRFEDTAVASEGGDAQIPALFETLSREQCHVDGSLPIPGDVAVGIRAADPLQPFLQPGKDPVALHLLQRQDVGVKIADHLRQMVEFCLQGPFVPAVPAGNVLLIFRPLMLQVEEVFDVPTGDFEAPGPQQKRKKKKEEEASHYRGFSGESQDPRIRDRRGVGKAPSPISSPRGREMR